MILRKVNETIIKEKVEKPRVNQITKEMIESSAWSPNPGSQTLYLMCSDLLFENSSSYNSILYHGGRAIGKSEVILADFAKGLNKGFGKFWYGVVFRKTVPELRDIINKARKFFIDSKAFGNAKLIKAPQTKIVFDDGEELLFMHMLSELDYDKHHGLEYSFIAFEELTLWSSKDVITNMKSCLRLQDSYNRKYRKEIAEGTKQKMVGKIRYTTNPYGAGKNWVKKTFIDAAPAGEFFLDNNITTIHIKGHYTENEYIQSTYINSFYDIVNKEKRDAWIHGDWNTKTGGVFGDLWKTEYLVKEPFKIPADWYVDRSMDFGTSSPFSILYFAESDGNPIYIGSNNSFSGIKEFCPPKGSIIVIGEFYGKDPNEVKANIGLNLTPFEIVNGMKSVEKNLVRDNILTSNQKINVGVADAAIGSNTHGKNAKTVLDMFNDENCKWRTPPKPNRAAGVTLIHNYLKATINQDPDKPHLYIFDSCKFLLENIPVLQYDPRKPDDVDTKMEDHDYDALRYRLHDQKPVEKSGNFKSLNKKRRN